MLLYVLATIGALTVALVILVLVLMFFGWLGQPIRYTVGPDEIQRYLRTWGDVLADGSRIMVRQPETDRTVVFVKRQFKRSGDHLVFRYPNSGPGRQSFADLKAALENNAIAYDLERTPTGRARALTMAFRLADGPLVLSSAAHATRVALGAPGTPSAGPFELWCTGSYRAGYVPGSVEVIPLTRSHLAGFRLGHVFGRLFGRL